jgi:uncharacterized spore protein YtfJ
MSATDMLQRISESLGSTANVRAVFGEPIDVGGKTVVPVAKVAYGFGAGSGTGRGKGGDDAGRNAEGGGGGGWVRAFPAGALEITAGQTRFVPFTDLRWMAGAFAAGALAGMILFGRRH